MTNIPNTLRSRLVRFRSGAALGSMVLALTMYVPARAQQADDQDPSETTDIVVTGTLVRGVAPAGTNVVGVSEKDIQATGATTVTELLTTVPQFADFNSLQSKNSGGNTVTTNRPNLRNLPGQTNSGTSATLLLVDGHRVVGMGVASTTPDADFLPPGIIERVEIVPDGGSALYGSDAVAGVVNFITRKRFDGVEADARYGFGKNFHTFDADLTVGKEWGDGSVYLSYNYAENGDILGEDRDFNFIPEQYAAGTTTVIRSLACAKPNLSVSRGAGQPVVLYSSLSPAAAGTVNICDATDGAALYPRQERHSVYAGLNQELSDWLEVDLRGFFYRKDSRLAQGQIEGSVNVGTGAGLVTSPYDVNLTGSPTERKTVNFALGPDYPKGSSARIDAWGFSSDFKADLGGGWQLRARGGYSESRTVAHSVATTPAPFGPLTAAGLFNPFNPAASDPSAFRQILGFEDYGEADQRQFDARLVADGNLFSLPGGMAKLAVGAEFLSEAYGIRKGITASANVLQLPKFNLSRNVKSVFGEIVAPVLGGGGGVSLNLSASGRYDRYSDVGGTFNPKLGATLKPVDWISLRGAWGKSFVAPSMADNAVADPTDARFISGAQVAFLAPPAVLAANGYPAVQSGQNILIVLGANPGLRPQSAKTWSLGADVLPPFAPGLRLSATYYNIFYKNIISQVPFTNQPVYYSSYAAQSFILNPTQSQLSAVLADDLDGTNVPCAPLPSCVYGIMDVRKQNLSGFKTSGLDFAATYARPTEFGSVDLSVGGSYLLTRKGAPTASSPFVSELGTFNSRLRVRSALGATVGNLQGQVIWNFSQGFDVPPSGLIRQTSVGDFHTFDLFLKYDVELGGVLRDLELTLNVKNLFDQEPPLYFGGDIVLARSGYLNGNTVGRLAQVGVRKKF